MDILFEFAETSSLESLKCRLPSQSIIENLSKCIGDAVDQENYVVVGVSKEGNVTVNHSPSSTSPLHNYFSTPLFVTDDSQEDSLLVSIEDIQTKTESEFNSLFSDPLKGNLTSVCKDFMIYSHIL